MQLPFAGHSLGGMADKKDDEFPETQWTDEARLRLVGAHSELIEALSAHLNYLTSPIARHEHAQAPEARRLEKAAMAYSEAEFDFTGSLGPFSPLDDWDASDEGDEADFLEDVLPTLVVSVLYRVDFDVTDESAIKLAGQAAYREMNPDLSDDHVQRAIGLGAAVYQVAHLNGLESLNKAPGLSPLGAVTQVIEPAASLDFDEANFDPSEPNAVFAVGGAVLFTSEDRWSM